MSSESISNMISSLLTKMTNNDMDIRFMAINDLLNELEKCEYVSLSDDSEDKIVDALLKLLCDKNSEVQNITTKCLGKLIKNLKNKQQSKIVNQLCVLLVENSEELRDIASIGLKIVITEIPKNNYSKNIIEQIIPKLLEQLNSDNIKMIQIDTVDILSNILMRFSFLLINNEMLNPIQSTLKKLLKNSRLAIRKRAMNTVGNLESITSEEMYNDMIQYIINELNSTSEIEYIKILISCIGVICHSNSSLFEKHINNVVPYIFKYSRNNDAELSEACIQVFETLVLRCPLEISNRMDEIINLAIELIKYDPNYVGDNEDDDEMMDENDDMFEMDSEDNDFDDDDELDYSDDDDINWKVRRASAKLIASIISTRSESLVMYYNIIAPVLISRLNEREETVHEDILNTLIIFVKQTNMYGANGKAINDQNSMDYQSNPKEQLYNLVNEICMILSKQILTKSITIRQIIYELLNQMIKTGCNLSEYIGLFISSVEQVFENQQSIYTGKNITSSNLKIEALNFLKELLSTHSSEVLSKYYDSLISILKKASDDNFYKITSESMIVLNKFIKLLRTIKFNDNTKTYEISCVDVSTSKYFKDIFEIIMGHLTSTDSDLEVKEKCIICLGVLISQAGDQIEIEDLNGKALPILLERLKNELTRITTLKVLNDIVNSPLLKVDDSQNNGFSIAPIIADTILESTNLLHQSQRQFHIVSLQFLKSVMIKCKNLLTFDIYHLLISELKPLISNDNSDLHVLPYALICLSLVIENCPDIFIKNNDEIIEIICKVIRLFSHVVNSGNGEESLLHIIEAITKVGGVEISRKCYNALLNNVVAKQPLNQQQPLSISVKQIYSVIANCVAVICINFINECNDITKNFVECIRNVNSEESNMYLSLLCIGEIGRKINLYNYYNDLHIIIFNLFSLLSEENNHASAVALGNIALGNLQVYIPFLIEKIKSNSNKLLVLLALKETISKYIKNNLNKEESEIQEFPFAMEIWQLLFQLCEENKKNENNIRNIISECLGKFSLCSPSIFLPDLQLRLNSENSMIRLTIVTAIRYTFTEQQQNTKYDNLLKPIIVDFLKLIKDTDLEVRRVALSTLNSAAYNKPYLIHDSFSELLPLVYSETNIHKELIHTVEMGPFKYQVDDGLEIRKGAYDCLYTILNNCITYLDIYIFISHVLNGLSDPDQEIKTLCHLIIQKLCINSSASISQRLDEMVDPLKDTIDKEPKKNAVKQVKDKYMELVRSTLRVIIKAGEIVDSVNSPKFYMFYQDIKMPNYVYCNEVQQIISEMEK